MRAAARAPGLAGVFAEGLLGDDLPFSVACPVDNWASAQVTLHPGNPAESGELSAPSPAADEKMATTMLATPRTGNEKMPPQPQTAAAIHQTLTHLARPNLDAHTLISESIPPTGILGHASAKPTAAIAAMITLLGMPPDANRRSISANRPPTIINPHPNNTVLRLFNGFCNICGVVCGRPQRGPAQTTPSFPRKRESRVAPRGPAAI